MHSEVGGVVVSIGCYVIKKKELPLNDISSHGFVKIFPNASVMANNMATRIR